MTDDSARSSVPDPSDSVGEAPSLESRVRLLSAHLEATAELPIERRTNRWLGEAEAVARDACSPRLDDGTVEKRVRQVRRLLAEVEEVDHDEAAERLESAKSLCDRMLDDW